MSTIQNSMIGDDSCDDLEPLWLSLAMGVTLHRYFLHVDPVLLQETGKDFEQRLALSPANCLLWAGIASCTNVHQAISSEYLSPSVANASALSSAMGNLTNVAIRKFLISQSGAGSVGACQILGLPTISLMDFNRLQADPLNKFSMAIQALFFAFLYAWHRETGDERLPQEVYTDISTRYGELASKITRFIPRLIDRPVTAHSHFQDVEQEVLALQYIPARDLALIVMKSAMVKDKYLEGLGIGQS